MLEGLLYLVPVESESSGSAYLQYIPWGLTVTQQTGQKQYVYSLFSWNWANPICPYALSCADPTLSFNTSLLILHRGRLNSHEADSMRSPSKAGSFLLCHQEWYSRSRLIPAGGSKCTCFPCLLSLGSGYTQQEHMKTTWLQDSTDPMVREAAPSTELEKGNLMARGSGASRAGGIELSDSQHCTGCLACLSKLSRATQATLDQSKSASASRALYGAADHTSEPGTALAGGGLVCFKPLS